MLDNSTIEADFAALPITLLNEQQAKDSIKYEQNVSVTEDLTLNIPQLTYSTPDGDVQLWANLAFEPLGEELFWKLKDYGVLSGNPTISGVLLTQGMNLIIPKLSYGAEYLSAKLSYVPSERGDHRFQLKEYTVNLSDEELLKKFAPVMAFHAGDYLPTGIEDFLDYAVLYGRRTERSIFGTAYTSFRLAFGKDLPTYVVFPAKGQWMDTQDYHNFNSAPHPRISFDQFPTILDSSDYKEYYLDILNGDHGGKDTREYYAEKSGAEPNYNSQISYRPYEDIMKKRKNYTVYGRVIRQNGKTYVQYHFFYLINEWNDNGGFVIGYHEGDWEGMMIELDDKQKPLRIAASAHMPIALYKGGETRKWVDAEKIAYHPVVYIGKGGHPTFLFNGKSKAAGIDDHTGTDILLVNDDSVNTSSVSSAAPTRVVSR